MTGLRQIAERYETLQGELNACRAEESARTLDLQRVQVRRERVESELLVLRSSAQRAFDELFLSGSDSSPASEAAPSTASVFPPMGGAAADCNHVWAAPADSAFGDVPTCINCGVAKIVRRVTVSGDLNPKIDANPIYSGFEEPI